MIHSPSIQHRLPATQIMTKIDNISVQHHQYGEQKWSAIFTNISKENTQQRKKTHPSNHGLETVTHGTSTPQLQSV